MPLVKIKNSIPESSGLARRKGIYFSLIVVQLEYRKSMHSCYPLTHRKQVNLLNLIFQVTFKRVLFFSSYLRTTQTFFLKNVFKTSYFLIPSCHNPLPPPLFFFSKSRHPRTLPKHSEKAKNCVGTICNETSSQQKYLDFLRSGRWNTLQQKIKSSCPRKKVNGFEP